jgi:hypothetical protein
MATRICRGQPQIDAVKPRKNPRCLDGTDANGDSDTPSLPVQALAKVIRHVGKAGDDFFAGGHFADAHISIAFSADRMLDP